MMIPKTFEKRAPIATWISVAFAVLCVALALTSPGTLALVLLIVANCAVSLGTLIWATNGK